MFERFTDTGRQVVVLAQEEARRLDHDIIGSEHLLLGLLATENGSAERILSAGGIELEAVRATVEETVGRGAVAPEAHLPFTPRAKRVLELSLREALQLGHNYIATGHLLLGLLREGDGIGAQILLRSGFELTEARQRLLDDLAAEPPEPMSSPGEPRLSTHLAPLGRTVSDRSGAVPPPTIPPRITPGLLAVVFVLVGVVGATVDRPPTTLGRVGLGVVLAGLVATLVAAVVELGPRALALHRRTGRLAPIAFSTAVLSFGVGSGLLLVDALLA